MDRIADSLERAKAAAGGNTGLARAIGNISAQAISQWKKVPAERVIEVERATGVSRRELRPDLYPPEKPEQLPSASPFTEAAQ